MTKLMQRFFKVEVSFKAQLRFFILDPSSYQLATTAQFIIVAVADRRGSER
jgi:hypothetical protein